MKDFGLQATQRITASSDPLRALTEMAQNFPNLAAALSRVAVPDALRSELKRSHQVVQGGVPPVCAMPSVLKSGMRSSYAPCQHLIVAAIAISVPDRSSALCQFWRLQ